MIKICSQIIQEIKIVKFKILKYKEWDLDFQTKVDNMRCTEHKKYFQLVKHTARIGKIKEG